MKYRLIHQERQWYGVGALCRAMGVSRGGYWAWVRRKPTARDEANVILLRDIRRVHGSSRGTYGSPRVHEALRKEGTSCGRKRVERLMRENGIQAKSGKKFKPVTTDSEHSCPVAPNVLDRRFAWGRPNAAWVADTTYIKTKEG